MTAAHWPPTVGVLTPQDGLRAGPEATLGHLGVRLNRRGDVSPTGAHAIGIANNPRGSRIWQFNDLTGIT